MTHDRDRHAAASARPGDAPSAGCVARRPRRRDLVHGRASPIGCPGPRCRRTRPAWAAVAPAGRGRRRRGRRRPDRRHGRRRLPAGGGAARAGRPARGRPHARGMRRRPRPALGPPAPACRGRRRRWPPRSRVRGAHRPPGPGRRRRSPLPDRLLAAAAAGPVVAPAPVMHRLDAGREPTHHRRCVASTKGRCPGDASRRPSRRPGRRPWRRGRAPGTRTEASPLATAEAASTWTIGPGDHLWGVATRTLAGAWGRPPSDHDVAAYLAELVAANRSALLVPDDPDLVVPGQTFSLPPPPAAPAAA